MALMQLGVFAAIPIVQQREKLILKRIGATPLPRWTLVGSNILLRLVIAAGQTIIILGIGILAFKVQITGSPLLIAGIVALGALTFTSLGYVVASFTRTEEAANGVTQVLQVPMMFMSGIFFPLELMPGWMRGIATVLPLTYLGDALRQTMVGGSPFVPLAVGLAILAGWLVDLPGHLGPLLPLAVGAGRHLSRFPDDSGPARSPRRAARGTPGDPDRRRQPGVGTRCPGGRH